MLLDMALGSEAPASFQHRCRVTAALLLIVCVTLTKSAPTTYDEIEAKQTDLAEYFNDPNGCYYNYQHYEEGDRIVTNEPCLNCTCHNRMLMCYLRVCPFSKAIGQDCTVQKTPDQCCPTISCPEVPVHLLTSSTTQRTTTTTASTTTVGWHDNYGCMMDENGFFPDGAQVPIDLKKPCELCYCIRNRTACVIQECTLHVEGCRPVYQEGVCCPVRYDCDYEIEKSTTTTPQITGGLVFATTSAPFDCRVNDEVYTDGESIAMNSAKPCEHCYCMRGDIVCVVQDCGEPLRGKDCTPEAPPAGQCCPTSYQCANETMDSYAITTLQPASQSDSDEHEAEKFPSNDDVYNKLGENIPGTQQEDTNDVESDHVNTTPIASNDIVPVVMSDQTSDADEETQDYVPDTPDAAEGTTTLPASDIANKISEENQQEISAVKPDSPNQVDPIGTESDPTKLASTDKPVEPTSADSVQPTQSPAADSSPINENAASPTTQATTDGNNNVLVNDENGNNGSPVENLSQDDIASNSPVVTTENAVESETHSANLQDDKVQEEIQHQTDVPSVIEKDPTVSSQDEQKPEQLSETTPQSEITSNKIENPPKTSDGENSENNEGENKIQTSAPLSEDVEQTTQQITQEEPEKTPLGETIAQTDTPASIVQDSQDQNSQVITHTPQEDIPVTDGPSNVVPIAQNNENSQEGNVSPTEIPKVDDEPVDQNKLPEENKPQTENRPESENASTESNLDSPQVENEEQTKIPNVENEPTEQNKLQEENKPAQADNKPELEKAPVEQNQDSAQGENVSATELPKVENQNKLQEENVSPTGLPAIESQDNTQEGNVSPTDVPKVENEPIEQNKPAGEDNSQTGSQPESDSTATEPNGQDSSQPDNVFSTEVPKVENEPIEQNQPLVEDNSQTGNQPESDSTASEPNSQDSSQSENGSSTEVPKVENEPTEQNKPLIENVSGVENQPEPGNKPTEQNQDSPQVENTSSTDIPNKENEPIEQNKPLVDTVTEQNNQDQSENVSPTEIPKVENEPTEQNKPTVEDKPQAENKPESENVSTENINQDSPQLENESSTEIPKVENEPTEQNKPSVENSPVTENQPESDQKPVEPSNQDVPQTENVSSTDTPKVENEPVEQNKPTVESSSQSEDQPESLNTPTETNSLQVENASSTDVPKVENEPTEQNKPLVESSTQSENQSEPQNTPTDKNQNNQQVENVPSTDAPKVENEPTEQNKTPVESSSLSENQPEPQNTPADANQNNQQIDNVSPTEIPKVENEPTEQNKPLMESNTPTENQSEPQISPDVPNQDGSQVGNISPTDIPTKLGEPQPDSASPVKPDTPVIPVNDLPIEQPINDNNVFVVTSTSTPLSSQNQIKDKESTSILNQNDNSETENKGDNASEKPQQSADDKISSGENINTDSNVSPVSSTELTPENNNVSPQTSDENTEHSTETKPIENEVNAGLSDNLANTPVGSTPTTETNDDIHSELINQGVLVDDSSSHDNEENGASNADSDDSQTEIPTETVSSTNGDSSPVDEHINDVTTSLPQQQLVDNNIPVQPEVTNQNEPVKTPDETKTPSDPNSNSENSQAEKSPESQVTTVINEVQNSDELLKPTDSPTIINNNAEQFTPTQIPVKINENESVTSHESSQDENVNEIIDPTTIYPDTSSDKTNVNAADGLNQNNQDNVTPSSVETSTNVQSSNGEPIKNINPEVPVENESSTASRPEQVNQDNLENADNVENSVTTNNYANVPSVIQTTYDPLSQENDNKGSFPAGQSDKVEINADSVQPANVKPQESSDETSTQYNADDSSTNIPIHESQSVNNNMEASTNSPVSPEIPNEINQDSVTESEVYATESPTDKNVVDSNNTPTNDATMEAISNLPENPTDSQTNANVISNENSSEGPQDADKPFVTKSPDYVIDITAVSSESPNNVPESINTENQANEISTSNIDKNNDATTVLYDNDQPGVPGEGSCLIDFVTYAHKAIVPKSNPCHEKCECLNSIVTCTSVNCPPAPPQHRNCIPLHPGNESWCCPTYMCEGGIEGMIFENHNNDGAPQLISTVVLEDKPGEENNDNTPIFEEVPTTFSPQSELEYNTLIPPHTDQNSELNSQVIGVTEVPAQTEIPDKHVDDSVVSNGENIVPTTIANLETAENEKPAEQDKPVETNEPSDNDKPVESDQPSESEKPVESDKPAGNEKPEDSIKPIESDQPADNEKPIDDSESDVTTVSYAADGQITTNKPETPNNALEQNVLLPNTANEANGQDNSAPSTELPNEYESTVQSVQPDNDQKQPGQNSDSGDLVAVTTYKPEDSVVDQQVDDNKTEGADQPTANEEADAKPIADVTYLPPSDISPVEVTQIPTIVADTRPTITENNENGGFRPSSIDDIINSVNMVKDAVKNSLETSSKPAEIDYQTTLGVVEDYQPTEVVPEVPASPLSSDSPLAAELPQTTVSSADAVPELPMTDTAVDDKLPESPVAATESSDETAGVTVPSSNQLPSADFDHQGAVSTDLPSQVPDTQEIATGAPSADVIANRPEEPTSANDDNKTPEATTVLYSPSVTGQDPSVNGPVVTSDVPAVPQSNAAEQSTNAPIAVDDSNDEKSPEVATAQPVSPAAAAAAEPTGSAGPAAFTDDTATESAEKPDAETPPVSADADKTPVAQVGQTTVDDKRFGAPSSSPAPPPFLVDHGDGHDHNDDDEKRPQDESAGEMVNIPFDTEKPSAKPSAISSSTPATAPYGTNRPSYTPIPQSTWTQKPFHQDSSTSEAPQPDQGFPDEYDDENEAVYGPGTCRYGGKIYVSAQQVPRDDPCDFCFCFRGDIICLQQSCPPPIFGCYQENIQGFCCPRYECPVAQATSVNVTTTTTTTTTMVPPHFFANAYRGAARRTGCLIHGHAYRVGEDVGIASGPCLECICGADGKMACDPKPCSPEPLLRKMMAEAVDQRRR